MLLPVEPWARCSAWTAESGVARAGQGTARLYHRDDQSVSSSAGPAVGATDEGRPARCTTIVSGVWCWGSTV